MIADTLSGTALASGDRALAHRPMVLSTPRRWRSPPIEAVKTRARSRSFRRRWEKTWFNWLENIQPWCVSRQLWWGHQIPAWYGISNEALDLDNDDPLAPATKDFVAATDDDAKVIAATYYKVSPDEILIAEDLA